MGLRPPGTHLSEFFRKAAFYRYHKTFQEDERDYKIRLASQLRNARSEIGRGPIEAVTLLERALKSDDNNLIN